MSDQKSQIVSGTGIAVRGVGPDSKAVEVAMRSAALAGHTAGHDEDRIAFAVQKARDGK